MRDYGTKGYYQDMFADVLADVQYDSPGISDNLVEAFKLAIVEWRDYHAAQVKELDRIEAKLND